MPSKQNATARIKPGKHKITMKEVEGKSIGITLMQK